MKFQKPALPTYRILNDKGDQLALEFTIHDAKHEAERIVRLYKIPVSIVRYYGRMS